MLLVCVKHVHVSNYHSIIYEANKQQSSRLGIAAAVVRVMDSHVCEGGSNPGQGVMLLIIVNSYQRHLPKNWYYLFD